MIHLKTFVGGKMHADGPKLSVSDLKEPYTPSEENKKAKENFWVLYRSKGVRDTLLRITKQSNKTHF